MWLNSGVFLLFICLMVTWSLDHLEEPWRVVGDSCSQQKHAFIFNTSFTRDGALTRNEEPKKRRDLLTVSLGWTRRGSCGHRPTLGRRAKGTISGSLCTQLPTVPTSPPRCGGGHVPLVPGGYLSCGNSISCFWEKLGRLGIFFEFAGFPVPLTQNSRHARTACLGVACSELLQIGPTTLAGRGRLGGAVGGDKGGLPRAQTPFLQRRQGQFRATDTNRPRTSPNRGSKIRGVGLAVFACCFLEAASNSRPQRAQVLRSSPVLDVRCSKFFFIWFLILFYL